MEQKNLLSKEGKKNLELELRNLIKIERPNVIAEIKEARERGDLSENAEYDAARDKQGKMEARIKELEKILDTAQTFTSKTNKEGIVVIGSTVTVSDEKGKEYTYSIVGSLEVDPLNGKISNASPVAKALLQHKAGDIVVVEIQNKYKLKIVEVK